MTIYYIDIKQCPNCDCQFAVSDIASCNTIDAKFYTDGFVEGPMYDEGSAFLICPSCFEFLWYEDIPTKGSMNSGEYFNNSENTLPLARPAEGFDYEHALYKAPWKNKTQEEYIRIRAWWSFNHVYREGSAGDSGIFSAFLSPTNAHNEESTKDFNLSPEQEKNLRSLLQLLDTNDSNRSIMKAEILRELGEFDECLKMINQEFDDAYLTAVDTIEKLAKSGIRRVEGIERNEEQPSQPLDTDE